MHILFYLNEAYYSLKGLALGRFPTSCDFDRCVQDSLKEVKDR